MKANWYLEIFKALGEKKVRYVLVGGVALNLHGIPRMTSDMDIVLQLDSENVKMFIEEIRALGFKPRAPIDPELLADPVKRSEWIAKRNMIVFSFVNPSVPYQAVDVFIKDPIPFSDLWRDRKKMRIDGVNIPLVSIEHLIEIKKRSNRLQDISDVEALERLKGEV